MDFFRHQEEARRQTTVLVAYFALAVLLTVAAVCGVVMALFGHSDAYGTGFMPHTVWHPEVAGVTALVTLSLIGLGCLYKFLDIRGGGRVVAELLGGSPVNPETDDPLERRLLNVVEEMAIASGIAVPQVYYRAALIVTH